MQSADSYWAEIHQLGRDAGLHELGVAPASPMLRARAAIEKRIADGLVNGMQFTFRNPERSTTPTMSVEGARSIIVGVRSYAVEDDLTSSAAYPARVARYAWDDHNAHLKQSLTVIKNRLKKDGHRAVVFADDNSIVDREAAYLAGLGWFGKNANLLVNGAGSFFVIGCVVTTAALPVATPVADGCAACTRCIPACPTGAIVSEGVIDANRCITWLLQKPGVFDVRYRTSVGDRIYGCDECQIVCPFTFRGARVTPGSVSERHPRSLDAVWLLEAADEEILSACDPWYIHERNPVWLRRNALLVLGNIGDPRDARVMAVITRALSDPNEIVRAHAVWAAARLGLGGLIPTADDAEMVRSELTNLPALRDDL